MLYVATTTKYVFDYHPGDVYWCTADVGWITGHSYVVYGPLANSATSVIVSNTVLHPGLENRGLKNPTREKSVGFFQMRAGFIAELRTAVGV